MVIKGEGRRILGNWCPEEGERKPGFVGKSLGIQIAQSGRTFWKKNGGQNDKKP